MLWQNRRNWRKFPAVQYPGGETSTLCRPEVLASSCVQMFSLSSASQKLHLTFCFCAGSRGRIIDEGMEHNLLFEISQHYKTKESTTTLAQRLHGHLYGLYFRPKFLHIDGETVNWKLVAYDVLSTWVDKGGQAHSLQLLGALKETNRDAADSFQEVLTCGKDIFCLGLLFEEFFWRYFSLSSLILMTRIFSRVFTCHPLVISLLLAFFFFFFDTGPSLYQPAFW